jgi:steroid delta-isomerase-like uncharacterized protein
MFPKIRTFIVVCVTLVILISICKIANAATEEEMRTTMQGLIEGLNDHDTGQMTLHCTDDIVYDFVAQPPPLNGKQELAAFFEGLFQGVPDIHSTQTRILVSGNVMVTEAVATGTHSGELSGIPATGSSLQMLALHIWEFEGDKIKRATEYLDMASMLMQMGLMPVPDLDPALLVPSFPVPDAEPTGLAPLEAATEFTSRWNNGDLSGMAKMIHPDANIMIAPLGIPLSRDAYIAVGEMMFQGFSKMPMEVVWAFDLGDGWVVTELLIKGTNDGPYMGMPATRRSITLRGVSLQRYNADGLITDLSSYYDNLTMLAQLGLFPPPDPEANKALEKRVFEEIWNQGLLEVADEVFAPDAVLHLGTDELQGSEGFKQYVAGYRAAFPDIHWTIEDQVAEGDMVVTRLTGTGTHQGELMGIPPTGLQVTATAIATVRIAEGKIQESWSSWDAMGLMQQLGVMPPTYTDPTWGAPSEVTGDPGDPVTNTATVLYLVQKFWNEHNVAALDHTHSFEIIAHDPAIPGHPSLYNMYKHVCLLYLAAFPDFRVTVHSIIGEADKVAVRWTVNGTHLGTLMGVPPTERPVEFTGATIHRLADGKIVENWWSYDALGMIQQITAPPDSEPPQE